MLVIQFGNNEINSENSIIERLVISNEIVNNTNLKSIFIVIKNMSSLLGEVKEENQLQVIDSSNNFNIFNELVTLQNIEVRSENQEIVYQYTFRMSL